MKTSLYYRPREWCVTPGVFGEDERVEWRTSGGASEVAQQAASRLQHRFASRIQRQLKVQNISVKQFCAASEKTHDRMLRILNGQMVMRLEDIGIAEVLLGEVAGLSGGEERAEARRQLGMKPMGL